MSVTGELRCHAVCCVKVLQVAYSTWLSVIITSSADGARLCRCWQSGNCRLVLFVLPKTSGMPFALRSPVSHKDGLTNIPLSNYPCGYQQPTVHWALTSTVIVQVKWAVIWSFLTLLVLPSQLLSLLHMVVTMPNISCLKVANDHAPTIHR